MWCIPPPPPQNLHLSTGQSENHETCESRQSCNYAEYLRCSNCLISWERITIVGLHTNHSPFIAGSILEVFVVTKDSCRLTLLCSGTCSETIHTGFFLAPANLRCESHFLETDRQTASHLNFVLSCVFSFEASICAHAYTHIISGTSIKCLPNYSGFICVTETPTGLYIHRVAAVCGEREDSRTEKSANAVQNCVLSCPHLCLRDRQRVYFLRAELICAFLLCKQRQMCVDWDLRFWFN